MSVWVQEAHRVAPIVQRNVDLGSEEHDPFPGRQSDGRQVVRARSCAFNVVEPPALEEDAPGAAVVQLDEFIRHRDAAGPLPIVVRSRQDLVDHQRSGDPGGCWLGEGHRIWAPRGATDGMSSRVMSEVEIAGECLPADTAGAAFHAGLCFGIPGGPMPPPGVGQIDRVPPGIQEPESVSAVAQPTGVDEVGGDIVDWAVIGSLEQEVSSGRDRAGQRDVDVAAVRELPSVECQFMPGWIEEFDPLIGGGGAGAGPSDLIN